MHAKCRHPSLQRCDASGIRFIKLDPHNPEWSAAAEAERLRWAGRYTPVPRVLESGRDAAHEWLVTEGLSGESAVSARWLADPATAVRAIGVGLRALHESLPVEECPFRWDVPTRLAVAAARGIRVPDALRPPAAGGSPGGVPWRCVRAEHGGDGCRHLVGSC
ncbi:phosphotransferase [Microbacterium sp. UBA837]|uniref:phosphotransferase n=1 Tax=Microbacterium sp. UBA837 TaxID=1946956 RepID=UPI0025E87149|nr:phosphotransferase [Microbacterium sp. UBA837]